MKYFTRPLFVLALLVLGSLALAQVQTDEKVGELYSKGYKKQALALGLERLENEPDSLDLNHFVGRCLVDLGRFKEGRPYLQKVVAAKSEDWRYAWSLNYLGTLAWIDGDDDAARRAWIEVRDGQLTRNVATNADNNLRFFALGERFSGWQRIQTKHCIFYFSTTHSNRDVRAFADEREAAYSQLANYFGGDTPWPVRFVVWGSTAEAQDLCGIKSLGFARPGFCLIHCHWNQTRGHELTHVISYNALRPTNQRPLINEGIAVLNDLSDRNRMATATHAVQAAGLKKIDLIAWWGHTSPVADDLFYPVAGAWVQALLDRGGKDKLFELFKDQTLAKARTLYGSDLDNWMSDFLATLLADTVSE